MSRQIGPEDYEDFTSYPEAGPGRSTTAAYDRLLDLDYVRGMLLSLFHRPLLNFTKQTSGTLLPASMLHWLPSRTRHLLLRFPLPSLRARACSRKSQGRVRSVMPVRLPSQARRNPRRWRPMHEVLFSSRSEVLYHRTRP